MPGPEPRSLFSPPPPVAELSDAERLAALRLARSENVGPVTFRDLIAHFGTAEAALAAMPELSRRGGFKRAIRLCTAAEADAEIERAKEAGAEHLFTTEARYPPALAALDAPPPLLCAKGRLALLNRPAVAVVGSRQCSAGGAKLARHFAVELGRAGYVVASGLARGIDNVAHAAALDYGTIAVLAGGIDVVYLPEHDELQRAIGEQGCLLTEMPVGFVPRGKDFPRRNRIISGVSMGVLIVEAARRSGTLVTARLAAEQGREVFAVPGHPLDPRAEGTNKLLKSGATLVTEASDLLSALTPLTARPPMHLRDPEIRLCLRAVPHPPTFPMVTAAASWRRSDRAGRCRCAGARNGAREPHGADRAHRACTCRPHRAPRQRARVAGPGALRHSPNRT